MAQELLGICACPDIGKLFVFDSISKLRQESRGDHYGPELREADAAHAEKALQRELRRRGWREAELERRRKGDPQKMAIAWRLRQETTMTLQWVAQRLRMGAWTHVSNCLVQRRKENEKCK